MKLSMLAAACAGAACSNLPGSPTPPPKDKGADAPGVQVTDDGGAPDVATTLDDAGLDAPVLTEAAAAVLDGGCTSWASNGVVLSDCHGPTPSGIVDSQNCSPRLRAADESRCTVTASSVSCSHQTATVGGREVDWQVPLGTPPATGWPAVVLLQPSLYPPSVDWSGEAGAPFGAFNYFLLEAMLLDNGFAVVEPTADNGGNWWDTNFPAYETSGDATFIPIFLGALESGSFGTLDRSRLYASGMSSGGFMTSRMAVSYAGTFRALAVQSGGYASCPGATVCGPTLPLPANHPPTMFLHGALDVAVPVSDAQTYYQALIAQGTEAEIIIDPNIMHEVLPVAPSAVTCWFQTH
jgi:poly(3-hydroxybutyrate) depolymerase